MSLRLDLLKTESQSEHPPEDILLPFCNSKSCSLFESLLHFPEDPVPSTALLHLETDSFSRCHALGPIESDRARLQQIAL